LILKVFKIINESSFKIKFYPFFDRYAAGGNNFSIFDIKGPEEETPTPKIPK